MVGSGTVGVGTASVGSGVGAGSVDWGVCVDVVGTSVGSFSLEQPTAKTTIEARVNVATERPTRLVSIMRSGCAKVEACDRSMLDNGGRLGIWDRLTECVADRIGAKP